MCSSWQRVCCVATRTLSPAADGWWYHTRARAQGADAGAGSANATNASNSTANAKPATVIKRIQVPKQKVAKVSARGCGGPG